MADRIAVANGGVIEQFGTPRDSTASPARPSSPTSWARPTGCRSSASTRTAPAWAVRNWPWTRRWAPRPAACSCAPRQCARQRRAAEQPTPCWPTCSTACSGPRLPPGLAPGRRARATTVHSIVSPKPETPCWAHAASRCWWSCRAMRLRATLDAGSAPAADAAPAAVSQPPLTPAPPVTPAASFPALGRRPLPRWAGSAGLGLGQGALVLGWRCPGAAAARHPDQVRDRRRRRLGRAVRDDRHHRRRRFSPWSGAARPWAWSPRCWWCPPPTPSPTA